MNYEIKFSPRAREDLLYWAKSDRKKLARIKKLLNAMRNDPFFGIGKPEPLKFSFSGFWSRRVTQEHRIIYSVEGMELMIANCRVHYLE